MKLDIVEIEWIVQTNLDEISNVENCCLFQVIHRIPWHVRKKLLVDCYRLLNNFWCVIKIICIEILLISKDHDFSSLHVAFHRRSITVAARILVIITCKCINIKRRKLLSSFRSKNDHLRFVFYTEESILLSNFINFIGKILAWSIELFPILISAFW